MSNTPERDRTNPARPSSPRRAPRVASIVAAAAALLVLAAAVLVDFGAGADDLAEYETTPLHADP